MKSVSIPLNIVQIHDKLTCSFTIDSRTNLESMVSQHPGNGGNAGNAKLGLCQNVFLWNQMGHTYFEHVLNDGNTF